MRPTFQLLTWRHGNRASISSSQAVKWLGHWECGSDAPRLVPVSPAANLLQSRGTGKSEGPATLVWSPFRVEQFCKWFGPETAVDEMRYSAQSMNVQTASGNACEVFGKFPYRQRRRWQFTYNPMGTSCPGQKFVVSRRDCHFRDSDETQSACSACLTTNLRPKCQSRPDHETSSDHETPMMTAPTESTHESGRRNYLKGSSGRKFESAQWRTPC